MNEPVPEPVPDLIWNARQFFVRIGLIKIGHGLGLVHDLPPFYEHLPLKGGYPL